MAATIQVRLVRSRLAQFNPERLRCAVREVRSESQRLWAYATKRRRLKMTTFWLSFHDREKPRQDQFLGVAIFDMDESEGEKSVLEIVRHAQRLGINPGGEVRVSKILNCEQRIKLEHKNRLITDDALLLQLGSSGRALDGLN